MLLNTLALLLQVASPAPTDARMLRDARTAQVRFEGLRRMNLPRDRRGGSAGRCDAQIGRYCYWYDSTESSAVPEPKRITDARLRLLAFLDSAAAREPADPWIAGQRVRYLIEGGRADDAVAVARACRADRWWCEALEGLALHVSQRYAAADSVFAKALRNMPESQRCEWHDLRLVADDRLSREIGRADCAGRVMLADRIWTLSQPLWSTHGNDLRTEHFARLTMAAVLARSANAHGMAWGEDSRQLLLRYGWAEWYTRHTTGVYLNETPGVLGHDREPSYYFFPEAESMHSTPRLTSSSWRLRDPIARTRYAPRHVKRVTELPHQLARFSRSDGDSMLIVVAFAITDTTLVRDSLMARLAVYRGAAVQLSDSVATRTLTMVVPRDTMIASIEVTGARSRNAARARYTVDPLTCAGWCVSDLLLFDASGYAGDSLELALPHALTATHIAVGRPLAVLWETDGSSGPSPAWISLTVEPLRVGAGRRLATWLHLADKPATLRLQWPATLQSGRRSQSVALRLPPKARGRYRMTMSIQPASALTALTSSREIELTP
jgi:hypothetical protein